MARLSPVAYAKKHARTGDRIARRAARLRIKSASAQGFIPSTGPSLASQIASALKRPGVIATGRPSTVEGVSAFHFSVRPITKGSEATALAGGTARPGASGAHQRYLEREGAAEKTLADIDVDHFAVEQQKYLERPEAVEQAPHVLASFGNISNLYEERMEFWRLAEEFARTPRTHAMTFNPGRDAEFWKAVDTPAFNAPAQIIEAARDKSTELTVDDPTAAAVLRFFNAHRSPGTEKTPAVGIEIGRGGRIQTRVIAELPHEVSAEKRRQIARHFCEERIANIEPPATEGPYKDKKRTLRYWAVIHAPDADNDSRNTHLHIVFHDRATDKMIDDTTGKMQWDFAITKTTTDKHWNKRTHRPHEQLRGRITTTKEWTVQSRAYFATLVNAALEEAGVKRRIDPRSYKDIGIDETPIPRIGPKAYQKEKQGTPTSAGDQTVAAQWDRELKRLTALYDTIVFDNTIVDRFNAAADRFTKTLHTSTAEIEKTFGVWAKAVVDKRGALAERAAVVFNIAKIRSRLTPPLDHRTKAEIAATKAVIDNLQKDELTPLTRLYRAALLKEKTGLATLAKLERAYSGTPQAAAAAAVTTATSPTAVKKVVTPSSPTLQPQPKAQPKAGTINFPPSPRAASAAKSNTATTAPPTPSDPPKAAQRKTYGSIPGLGSSPKFKPTSTPDLGFNKDALAQMEAERIRQFNLDWQQRHDAYTGPLKKAIADITTQIADAPDIELAVDNMYAERQTLVTQTADFDAATVEIDDILRNNLRNGRTPYNDAGIADASRNFLNERLAVIAKDKDPSLAAAAVAALATRTTPAQSAAAPQPQAGSPTDQPASVAERPVANIQPDRPAAEIKTEATTANEPKPAGVKPVEPQPAPAPLQQPATPTPNLYRRRTRVLTPEERSALTKTHITTKPKPKDDIPETMPAHARRRRPQLHDEPPADEAAVVQSPTAAPRQPTTDVEPAAPAAALTPTPTATPARPAEPVAAQQPIATPAKPAEPKTAPAPSQPTEPPAIGPTIDIAALPEAKKRKKKKFSELSADERRRTSGGRER
jgi:hypothetical protein